MISIYFINIPALTLKFLFALLSRQFWVLHLAFLTFFFSEGNKIPGSPDSAAFIFPSIFASPPPSSLFFY